MGAQSQYSVMQHWAQQKHYVKAELVKERFGGGGHRLFDQMVLKDCWAVSESDYGDIRFIHIGNVTVRLQIYQ